MANYQMYETDNRETLNGWVKQANQENWEIVSLSTAAGDVHHLTSPNRTIYTLLVKKH